MSDFYYREMRRARKEHECECMIAASRKDPHRYRSHNIHKGQRYAFVSQVYDGNFTTSKLCLIHLALISAIFEICEDAREDGIDYSRAREYYKEMERNRDKVLRKMREIHRELRKGKR